MVQLKQYKAMPLELIVDIFKSVSSYQCIFIKEVEKVKDGKSETNQQRFVLRIKQNLVICSKIVNHFCREIFRKRFKIFMDKSKKIAELENKIIQQKFKLQNEEQELVRLQEELENEKKREAARKGNLTLEQATQLNTRRTEVYPTEGSHPVQSEVALQADYSLAYSDQSSLNNYWWNYYLGTIPVYTLDKNNVMVPYQHGYTSQEPSSILNFNPHYIQGTSSSVADNYTGGSTVPICVPAGFRDSAQPPYKCPHCEAVFDKKASVSGHMASHFK